MILVIIFIKSNNFTQIHKKRLKKDIFYDIIIKLQINIGFRERMVGMNTKLYVARLREIKECTECVGLCRYYVHEGKDVMSFQFFLNGDIFEMLAETQESIAPEVCKCHMSMRQKDTEKHETYAEWEANLRVCKNCVDGVEITVVEGSEIQISVNTNFDFTDFCQPVD